MGNSASAPERARAAKRRAQKLSKPRTGDGPTTAGLLSRDGFSTTAPLSDELLAHLPDPLSSSPVPHPSSDTGTTLEGVSRRSSVISFGPKMPGRKGLFRSTSASAKPSKPKKVGGAPPPGNLARSSTLAYEPALLDHDEAEEEASWPFRPDVRTSWTYDFASYEAKRLLNLVEESGTEHEVAASEHKTGVLCESTWENPLQPIPTSTSIRANSEITTYTPVRRRSVIMTPGVATRAMSFRVFPPSARPGFRLSHPATPTMPRRASVESFRSGVVSMPPSPSPRELRQELAPRVVTPSEDGYHVTGAFKLGSLRITNGAASPVSLNTEWGTCPGDAPHADKVHPSHVPYAGEKDISLEHGNANGSPKEDDSDADGADETLEMAAPQRRIGVTASRPVTASSLSPASANGGVSHSERPQLLAEINVSPLSLTIPSAICGGLETTSKHTAVDDKLFEDEDLLEYAAEETLEVRLDADARSQPMECEGIYRTDSGFLSSISPSSETRQISLTKADSGYSSNVSLRSLKTHDAVSASTREGEAHLSSLGQDSKGAGVVSQSENTNASASTTALPQTGGRSAAASSGSGSGGGGGVRSETKQPGVKGRLRPSMLTLSTLREMSKSPDSTPKTPLSSISSTSSSGLSTGSVSRRPSKLKRFLSGAKRVTGGSLSTQMPTTHVPVQNGVGIPAVPADAESKPREHSGLFSLAGSVAGKRLALRPHSSKETLKTILSLGSLEANLESAHIPVTLEHETCTSGSGAADACMTSEPVPVPSALSAANTFKIARKPVSKTVGTEVDASTAAEDEAMVPAEAEMTSLASIKSSLGNNAYDAAFLALERSRPAQRPRTSGGGRTMSLTRSVEYGSFPTLSVLARELKCRTPPPVSMGNKKARKLRAPPSVRTRHADGETFQSLASHQTMVSGEGLSMPAQSVAPMSPHRVASAQRLQVSRHAQVMTSWDVQTDLGWQHRWARKSKSLDEHGRHSRPMSAHTITAQGVSRPSSEPFWQGKSGTPFRPPLRHRASYDGSGPGSWSGSWSGYGYGYGHGGPDLHARHGGRRLSYQHAGPSWPHLNPAPGYWDQAGRRSASPHVPYNQPNPGHHRSRDWNGQHVPYRVLHSYNSPAYRNVPIWG